MTQLANKTLDTDLFKLLLIDNYKNLRFLEKEMNHLKCVVCKKVAIIPFKSNCQHLHCLQCKIFLCEIEEPKCFNCFTIIDKNLFEEDETLAKEINRVKIKCLCYKSGCKHKDTLLESMDHILSCKNIDGNGKYELLIKYKFIDLASKDGVDSDTDESESEIDDNIKFTKDDMNTDCNNTPEKDCKTETETTNKFNMLLMSETGSGKSTFVNAIFNYVKYKTFYDAKLNHLDVPIPMRFAMADENYQSHEFRYGSDENENPKVGESCTQNCRTYELRYKENLIRIIDTPGVGDTGGIGKDKERLDETLHFLSNIDEVHAICILLQPNQSRLVTGFEYCLKQILSQLNKSAVDNIVFLFTHTKGTSFMPGETMSCLEVILDNVKNNPPYVNITFKKDNIFCLDNDGFKILVAHQHPEKGIKIDSDTINGCAESWNKSAEESQRLLDYLVHRMKPHSIKETLAVNHARRVVRELFKPIAQTIKVCDDNSQCLLVKIKEIEDCKKNKNKKQLRRILATPIVRLVTKPLEHPRTVCTSEKCVQLFQTGQQSTRLQKNCCETCKCFNEDTAIITPEQLKICQTFNSTSGNCNNCGCSYKFHQRIREETETSSGNIRASFTELELQKDILKVAENFVIDLKILCDKYTLETFKLDKYWSMLSVFLRNNAIIVDNDAVAKQREVESKKGEPSTSMMPLSIEGEATCSSLEAQMEQVKSITKGESASKTKGNNALAPKIDVLQSDDVMQIINEMGNMELIKETFQFAVRSTLEKFDQDAAWIKKLGYFIDWLKGKIGRNKEELSKNNENI